MDIQRVIKLETSFISYYFIFQLSFNSENQEQFVKRVSVLTHGPPPTEKLSKRKEFGKPYKIDAL